MTHENYKVQILLFINKVLLAIATFTHLGASWLFSHYSEWSWVVVAETGWSAKLKIFTFWFFQRKFAYPGFWETLSAKMLKASRPFADLFHVPTIVAFVTRPQDPRRWSPDGVSGDEHLWTGNKVCIFRFIPLISPDNVPVTYLVM